MLEEYSYIPEELPEVICHVRPDWVNIYNEPWRIAFNKLSGHQSRD